MRRRWVLSVVVATVAVLLVGEATARAIGSDLPPLLRYHSYEADLKVHRMDQLHRSGGADIAFVGTSQVYDIDPSVLPASVDGRTTGYNAALGSGIPALASPWAIHSVLPRLHPRLLVLGLTSYDLSDDSRSLAIADAYLASKGGQHDLGRSSLMDNVDHWLAQRSSLWDHRTAMRDPAKVLDAIRGRHTVVDPVAATIQPTGRPSFDQTQRFEDRTQAGGGDLRGWAIGMRNVAAVRTLLRDAKAAGVRVALLNMPVTAEYIAGHPNGAQDYARYLTFLQGLADEEHVTLIDASPLSDHRYFADEVHLNLTGARVLTPLLVTALRAHGLLDGIVKG